MRIRLVLGITFDFLGVLCSERDPDEETDSVYWSTSTANRPFTQFPYSAFTFLFLQNHMTKCYRYRQDLSSSSSEELCFLFTGKFMQNLTQFEPHKNQFEAHTYCVTIVTYCSVSIQLMIGEIFFVNLVNKDHLQSVLCPFVHH